MKHIIYIAFFLSNLSFGQTLNLTETDIEKYAMKIDQWKTENKLVKISYPNMSACGGGVDGYYLNQKLVLIDSRYNAELGFTTKTYYLDQDKFLKIVHNQHFAEWGKYEQNYPPDKFEYDASKMTYTDTTYSIMFSDPIVFQKKSDNKLIGHKIDQTLMDRLVSCGQEMRLELDEVLKQVDSLRYVEEMPYICPTGIKDNKFSTGCGDDLYWNVVMLRDNIIELLIDKLDDTTTTKAFVPYFGGYHTIADLAFVALEEIIHGIPTFELLGVKFDENGCGYCSYWQHLRKSNKNRKKFKQAVKEWYFNNKEELTWVESNFFSSCDCSGEHPNGGHYRLKSEIE